MARSSAHPTRLLIDKTDRLWKAPASAGAFCIRMSGASCWPTTSPSGRKSWRESNDPERGRQGDRDRPLYRDDREVDASAGRER